MRSIEDIIDDTLDRKVFGSNFKFRKGQRETIVKICSIYLDNPESSVILDAPTGTGKSIIAMWVSVILNQLTKRGYIITSDLALQTQYESDIDLMLADRFRIPSVKGVDNYECHVNSSPFSLGECQMRGLSYKQIPEHFPCYNSCDYLLKRNAAINSGTSILNYSFWLIQRNYVASKFIERGEVEPFMKRDFTIFDEAHKIDDIIQNHFSPIVSPEIGTVIFEINKFLHDNHLPYKSQSLSSLRLFFNKFMSLESDKDLVAHLSTIEKLCSGTLAYHTNVKNKVKLEYGFERNIPKAWRALMKNFDSLKDIHCKIQDYLEIIKEGGQESVVIHKNEFGIKFMTLREDLLTQKFLHSQAGFKLFMSATIGDPKQYAISIGIKDATIIRLDNQFNFDKSPIIFINRHKLSYSHKEENLPKNLKILKSIIKKHGNERGIIHSGSYEFSRYLLNNLEGDPRIINYGNSREKEEALEQFKNTKNGILIGPSILEGLDMKNEMSRFQVFFKVPYPSLGDPLTKEKAKRSNVWYNWKTSLSIMQGVGRSIRNDKDWAVTYILDACFASLIHQDLFPPHFKERIKIIK